MENNKKKTKSTGCVTIGIILIVLFLYSLEGIEIDENGFSYDPIKGLFKHIKALLILISGFGILMFIIHITNQD